MKNLASLVLLLSSPFTFAQSLLTLDDASKYAREHSPMLKEARSEYASALASSRKSLSMLGPQIGINGLASQSQSGAFFSSPPGSDPGSVYAAPSGAYWAANVMAMFPLFAPQLRAMADAGSFQARAAAGRLKEREGEVVYMVAEAFSMALGMRAEAEVACARLQATQEMLRTVEARFQAGATIQAQVDRVRAEVSRAERGLVRARNAEAKALLELKEAMGSPLDSDTNLSGELGAPTAVPDLKASLLQARQSRGLILEATAAADQTRREVKAAQSQRLPRAYAIGMADVMRQREMGGLSVGLAVSLPLFDSGQIRSDVNRAKAMQDAAEARHASAVLQVEKEVRQAILDIESAVVNRSSADAELQAATTAYGTIKERVEVGKSILVEQLDAFETLTMAQSEVVKAQLEFALALARLHKATGGTQ